MGTITYEHDEEGRLSGAKLLKDGRLIGTIVYRHDPQGNLIEEHWDFGGRWSQTSTYEYEKVERKTPPSYASTNVHVVNTADYRIVGESYDFDQAMTGTSSWEYDEDGKLVRKPYVTSTELRTDTTLEYDAEGRVKTGKFTGEQFNADITFERDANGNTTSIHWAFDFGKTQTYSMKYEKIVPKPAKRKGAAGKD